MHTQHFFFGHQFFPKRRSHFCRAHHFVIAASVVQHSVSVVLLLVDSVVPVACNMRSCPSRIGNGAACRRRNRFLGAPLEKWLCNAAAQKTARKNALRHTSLVPASQSGTKGQNSFILIVCPAQTILSRSSTSQCPSALFNLTAAAVPRCTVFARE